jgi:hypothetical protein
MNESLWLSAFMRGPLLQYLQGRASARKARLFFVAACRRIRAMGQQTQAIGMLDVAERYADGLAERDSLTAHRRGGLIVARNIRQAHHEDVRRHGERSRHSCESHLRYLVVECAAQACKVNLPPQSMAHDCHSVAVTYAWDATQDNTSRVWNYDRQGITNEEEGRQCQLLRCLFGNPFRPVRIDPSWLRWNDGTVPKIAAAIYDERAFDRLPILADALLDAGCDDEQVLAHCRSAGPHARGCWVVDALLGKS